jgi:hypothetical protein
MKTCPYCAASIEDAAVRCTQCHRYLPVPSQSASPRGYPWTSWVPLAVFGAVVLIVLAIVRDRVFGPGRSTEPLSGPSAASLLQAYVDNPARAASIFNGQRVMITGIVRTIGTEAFGAYVILDGSDRDRELRASLSTSDAAQLERGSLATVICTVRGQTSPRVIAATQCRLQRFTR